MTKQYKTDEGMKSTELQDLALFFFKQGGCTAKEAYDHAHSFLSISKNKYGEDIVDVFVNYESVRDSAPEASHGARKYFLYYVDAETGSTSAAVITILGDYVTADKADKALNEYILKNMIPKRLTEDNGKALKIKLVRKVGVKEFCKGVFVEKSIIICD